MEEKNKMLREFFETKGITQEQLAEKLGVDKAHVNKLISGKKQFGKQSARKWSDLFGLSYSWLLTGEGKMEASSTEKNPDVPYYLYKDLMERYEAVVRENENLRTRLALLDSSEKRNVG